MFGKFDAQSAMHYSFILFIEFVSSGYDSTTKKSAHFLFSRELNSRTCCCFAFNWRKRVLFHFISSIIWHSISCSVINPIISHNVLNSQFCFHFMCDELYYHDEVCPMVSCSPAHSVFYPRAECVSPQQNCQLFFTIIKQKNTT